MENTKKIYVIRNVEIEASNLEEAKKIFNSKNGIKTFEQLKIEVRELIENRINENITKLLKASENIKTFNIDYSDKLSADVLNDDEEKDFSWSRRYAGFYYITKGKTYIYKEGKYLEEIKGKKMTFQIDNTQRRTRLKLNIDNYDLEKEAREKVKDLYQSVIYAETKEDYNEWLEDKDAKLNRIDEVFNFLINEIKENGKEYIKQENKKFKAKAKKIIDRLRELENTISTLKLK